jgi:biopolymer transport protein ExbB/TolQ
MKRSFPAEFVYQVLSLLLIIVVIHAFYAGLVRPNATAILTAQAAAIAANPAAVIETSLWVILKDWEQEAEVILTLWGIAIMAWKARDAVAEQRMFDTDLLALAEGQSILPEDARQYARAIEALPATDRERLLPQALLTALSRFRSTRSIADVSAAVDGACDARGDRMDSELSMVRYIAWAIPSIGFIGTVRGIGDALSQAHKAVEGDIAGVTEALGVAFNSTLIALLLSIVLMFLLYQLQLVQERLVLDTRAWCDRRLLQHLQAP